MRRRTEGWYGSRRGLVCLKQPWPALVAVITLLAGLLFASPARSAAGAAPPALPSQVAQSGGQTIYDGCMQDVAGFELNCTASDVRVASITDIVIVDPCDYPGDTAVLDLTAEFLLTSSERHDLGIYISAEGGDGLTGACSVSTVPYAPDPPFVDLDGTSDDLGGVVQDTCGDIDDGHNPILHDLTGIVVQCIDSDGDGEIEVNAGLSWRQPGANELCTSPLHAFPGTPSKCRVQQLPNLTVPVPGRIIVDKVTDPPDDPTSFDFLLTGGPIPVGHPFILTGQAEPFDSVAAGLILWAGTYSVAETVPPTWELTSATCTDGSDPAAIDLAPGETVTCTFTDTIVAAPSLVLTKEISTDAISWSDHITVPVGAELYYRFAVQNMGNVAMTSTSITDPDVDASGCTFTDPLPPGQTTNCTVGPVPALEGLHTNTAYASADYRGQTSQSNTDSASHFAAAPSIALTKTVERQVVREGETVSFNIRIANTGNTAITNLVLGDTYDPSYLTLTSWSVAPDGHDPTSGVITWTDALSAWLPFSPDEVILLALDFRAEASTVPDMTTNVAAVGGVDEYGYPVGPDEDSADVMITRPGIAVRKTLVDPPDGVAVVSDTITFTIRITNTGDTTISSLMVVDTYDECMLMTSVTPDPVRMVPRVYLPLVLGQGGAAPRPGRSGGASGGEWPSPAVWYLLDPLPPSEGTALTVDFGAGSLDPACVNSVEVTAWDEYGQRVGPERDDDEVRIAGPDIDVLKMLVEPPDGVAVGGDTVTFTIRLTNTGDTTITNLTLTDAYDPDYLTLTSFSEAPDGHDAATGVITWTNALGGLVPLAPDGAIVLTVGFRADASTMPGVTANLLVAQGVDEYGHSVGPADDNEDVRITQPGITVVKELSDRATGTAEVGETATFRVRITNTGDTPIASLVVTDAYDPNYLVLTSWSVAPDDHDAATGVVTWTHALNGYLPLAPDDAIVLTIDFRANEPTAPDVTTNTVTVRGQDQYGDPVGPDDGSDDVEIIAPELVSVRLRYYWYPIDPRPPGGGRFDVYAQYVQQDVREAALGGDAQFVMILDENGDWLETLEVHSSDAQTWIYSEHDLMHYAGQTIWLYFGVYNDGDPVESCALSMFVDEVSLQACYGARPTCVEIVVNGGFEVDDAWFFPVTAYPAGYSTDRAYRGFRSMRAGITEWSEDRESYSSGWQRVTIPEEWTP